MRTFRLAALAALTLATVGCAAPIPMRGHAPHHATPRCQGAVVTVWRDAPVGCNLTPPQRLDVAGIDAQSCADQGGEWVAPVCHDVDY